MATDLISQFIIHMTETGKTDDSRKTYEWVLRKIDADLRSLGPYGLYEANEEEIKAWLWRDGLSLSSRATYHAPISRFFAWAVDREHIDFNPTLRIACPKVIKGLPRVAGDDQVRRVMAEAPQPLLLWGKLALYGGLRCIEISRLDRESITAEKMIVFGKGNKTRLVPTHPVIWEAVAELGAGPLTDCTPHQISLRFFKWCRRNGLRGVSMHRLRGWHATKSYRHTRDIRAVQQNLGHQDPSTTARYIDVADDQQIAAVSALPDFSVSPGAAPE